jgi:hypothetical protein
MPGRESILVRENTKSQVIDGSTMWVVRKPARNVYEWDAILYVVVDQLVNCQAST